MAQQQQPSTYCTLHIPGSFHPECAKAYAVDRIFVNRTEHPFHPAGTSFGDVRPTDKCFWCDEPLGNPPGRW